MAKLPPNPFSRIKCANCKKSIAPESDFALQFMMTAAQRGRDSFTLTCTSCKRDTKINPKALLAGEPVKEEKSGFMLRCPERICPGYACNVEGKTWLCGECGEAWPSLAALEKAISASILERPHRKAAYVLENGHWLPSPSEPENYEEMIEAESAEPPKKSSKRRRS